MQLEPETGRYVESCRRGLPDAPTGGRVVFGFDGVVDNVRKVVAKRLGPEQATFMSELSTLGDRITRSAANRSSLAVEWVDQGTRTGGHVSHLTRAFGRMGFSPTLVGTVGDPPREEFAEEFGDYTLLSLGRPEYTDAVEFDDGKFMLRETGAASSLDWTQVQERVGLERLAEAVDGSRLLGVGYWSAVPRMPSLLEGLATDLWPRLDSPPAAVLTDPGDVRQLRRSTLEECVDAVRTLDGVVPVTVSANRAETVVLAELFERREDWTLRSAVEVAHAGLGTARFVGHVADHAVSASDGTTCRVQAPYTASPEMVTSAGDHFNAGLALGTIEGLDDGPALVLANALAGWFVRNGRPPSYDELTAFVDRYESQ